MFTLKNGLVNILRKGIYRGKPIKQIIQLTLRYQRGMYEKESNVIASLPYEYEEDDYYLKYKELTIGLSLGIALIGIELIGFFSGITMFKNSICLASIFLHGLACLATAQWLLQAWQISSYWLIFIVCIFVPACVEAITIVCSFIGPNKDL